MLRVAISQPAPAERLHHGQGARFEVRVEKARGNHGEHVKPFDARGYETRDGAAAWTMKDVEDARSHVISLSFIPPGGYCRYVFRSATFIMARRGHFIFCRMPVIFPFFVFFVPRGIVRGCDCC